MKQRALWVGMGIVLAATVAGCTRTKPFVADNLYDEPRPPAPSGEAADDAFAHPPWDLQGTRTARVRYQREAKLGLPDRAEQFALGDVFVYAKDGSDVQLEYRSALPGPMPASRVVIRVSVYRSRENAENEWRAYQRRWHEKQAGTLTEALPLPDAYPADTKRMAWVLPLGDGYGGPVFQEAVFFQSGGWSVRYEIECADAMRPAAASRISGFLGWIKTAGSGPILPPGGN